MTDLASFSKANSLCRFPAISESSHQHVRSKGRNKTSETSLCLSMQYYQMYFDMTQTEVNVKYSAQQPLCSIPNVSVRALSRPFLVTSVAKPLPLQWVKAQREEKLFPFDCLCLLPIILYAPLNRGGILSGPLFLINILATASQDCHTYNKFLSVFQENIMN